MRLRIARAGSAGDIFGTQIIALYEKSVVFFILFEPLSDIDAELFLQLVKFQKYAGICFIK